MWLDAIWMDFRYSLRSFRKSPGVVAMAVLSLALGIGATTAIYSVMDALMLRKLPVKDPQQLAILYTTNGVTFSNSMWRQIRSQQDVFSSAFAYIQTSFTLGAQGEKQLIHGNYVSDEYFRTMGVQAYRGRTLQASDDVQGAPLVCVISYDLWRNNFGKSDRVIGQAITLSGHPFEVVGVLPPDFSGVDVGESVDAFAPLASERIVDAKQAAIDAADYWWMLPRSGSILDADQWSLTVGGRLKSGVSAEQAEARMRDVSPAIIRAALPANVDDRKKERALHTALHVQPIPRGVSDLRDIYNQTVTLMLLMAGAVLIITCANMANFLLARSAVQQGELATRLAHGASRWRLIRQVFTESFLLSASGAVLGVILARWGGMLLIRQLSISPVLSRHATLYTPIDAKYVCFILFVVIMTTLLCGVTPAQRVAKLSPYSVMKCEGAGFMGRRDKTRRMLITAQVALSMTLLVGVGLLMRTVQNLMAQEQGCDPNNVLTVHAALSGGEDRPEWKAFVARELLEKFRAMPGVTSAARIASERANSIKPNAMTTQADGPVNRMMGVYELTSPDYFKTMRVPMSAGRDFREDDSAVSPAVAILSESASHRLFPGVNPIGLSFQQLAEDGRQTPVQVIGVVKDEKEMARSNGQPYPMIYRPIEQCSAPCPSFGSYELRYAGSVNDLKALAKATSTSVDPHLMLEFSLMTDAVNGYYQKERMSAMQALLFGVLALVQAGVGIYGVTSYSVAQRIREIGLRMALGAQAKDVLRLIIGESMRAVIIGVMIGALGAYVTSKLIQDMLFGVSCANPMIFMLSASVMFSITLLAAFFPVRSALKTDPNKALRAE